MNLIFGSFQKNFNSNVKVSFRKKSKSRSALVAGRDF